MVGLPIGGQVVIFFVTLHRFLRGCNASSLSNLNPVNRRRDLVMLSALIEYPGVGLILYETGCAENVDVSCQIVSHCSLCITEPNTELASAHHGGLAAS
jgi:hypothetical protein